jgi:ATP-dependent Zn protease
MALLTANKDKLEAVAQRLLKEEVLEGAEFEEIIGGPPA